MSDTVSLVQRKVIQSLLYGNYDIINIYFARVYTCGKESKFWLYSGLEGALVYCIEVRAKTCKFLLFDLKSYEITFDCELYKRFNNAYQKGTDTFYYFGVNDGFIGFEIPDTTEATELENEIIGFSDEMVKGRLRDYKPMKDNELKEKGRQMIQHLKTRLHSSGGKSSKSEIVINQGELENKINTVEVDDANRRLILTGTSYKGIDRDLKKVKGLYLEQNSNAQESDVYSKYMARNILGSLMKGLVVPKRKIDRKIWEDGEEPTAPSQDDIKEKKEKEKERKKEEKEREKERKREEKERKEREKKEKKKKSVANVSPPKSDVKFLDSGKPSGPPPPPPPPMVHNEINPEFEKKAKEEAAKQPKKSSKPVDLAAELAAKKNALAHVEVKEYVSPALQKQGEGGDDGGAAAYGGNSMMAAIMAKRNAMKKVGGGGPGAAPSNPAPARPPPRQSNPTVQPPKPSFQPPKPSFQPPKPAPKPTPKKSEPAYVPPAKEPSPPKVTFLDKGKGSGKAPPPPPPPPMIHNEFNPEFAKKAKEEAAKQPKKTSSRPVDLAAELAAKKKNLAKVEVKEYVSPALQKQGEGGGDDGAAAYGGNSMMAAIMAKRNAMKKIGGGGPATGTTGGTKPAFQPPAAKPAFQPAAAKPAFQPAAAKPSFQPAAAKPSFQPAAAKPSFQPAAAKPHFQPATAKPSFQPAAAKPHFQPAAATSSGAAKPGFNPPGARPPMKIGAGSSSGGFASMIAALSNKMGGGAGGNKSSAPSEPANTKPIVELAAGTKKQLNMNKLIGSLNQSMAKKNQVTEKQPEVKFLDSGKPKGPPPPPPPPLPK